MQIILIDDVFELGKQGEVVRVADGYGRNYLIPKGFAIPATAGNLRMIEQQRVGMAKKEAKDKEHAQILTEELNQLHLLLSRKTGDTGVLFGSVTSKDITDLLEQQGIHLDRRKILLDQPIKIIGNHTIEVRPHSDVAAELLLSVLVESDEPVAQVRKKDKESEQIVADLEAKVKEIEQLKSAQEPEEPEVSASEPQSTLTDTSRSQQQEGEPKTAKSEKPKKPSG